MPSNVVPIELKSLAFPNFPHMTLAVHQRPTDGHPILFVNFFNHFWCGHLEWFTTTVFILISDTTPLNSVTQYFIDVNEAADFSQGRI